ncbi:hypothetical protein AAG570_002387 [Ranatra chinensis]|uniref:MH2 domain-containing protein n=1 Tax=Ranatra chinensis TaxID=642074 RepID=A0ABD0Y7D2_9HEMI
MDDQGNILVKRVSKSNVYVKSTSNGEETSIGAEVLKLPNCSLETDKPVKLFDMKKFQTNVSRELRRAYPDRRRLECQCLSAIAFVKSEQELLECPIWVLIINVVAMDMLKSKLPPVKRPAVDIRNRPRIPVPDEDPYSVANGGGSSGSSGGGPTAGARRSDKPPKLPPRDNPQYQPHHIPKPDYDDINDAEEGHPSGPVPAPKPFPSSRSKDKQKDSAKHDDPYYCGLRARVPNFVKRKMGPAMGPAMVPAGGRLVLPPPHHIAPVPSHYATPATHHHPLIWHARSYDSGMDTELLDSPYNHIYGRLPIPTRGYIPPSPRTMYIGEWD